MRIGFARARRFGEFLTQKRDIGPVDFLDPLHRGLRIGEFLRRHRFGGGRSADRRLYKVRFCLPSAVYTGN